MLNGETIRLDGADRGLCRSRGGIVRDIAKRRRMGDPRSIAANVSKTKLRNNMSTERQRTVNCEAKPPCYLIVAQNFQFNHRLPALMTPG